MIKGFTILVAPKSELLPVRPAAPSPANCAPVFATKVESLITWSVSICFCITICPGNAGNALLIGKPAEPVAR